MPLVPLDMSDREKLFTHKQPEPAPPGNYIFSLDAECLPLKIEQSSKGKDMIAAHIRLEANSDGSDTPAKGKIVFNYISLEKMSHLLSHMALSLGAMTKSEIEACDGQIDTDVFDATQRGMVEIVTKPEKYEGEDRIVNRVKKFLWEE